MVAGGAVVGLIELFDDAERDWHRELEFLTSVAQLVAGLRSGEVTNAQLEAQVKASGFKLEDVLVVKLTVTEKTMNSVGVDALGLNAEHGVQTAKPLYEAKLNNEGRFESTVSYQDSRSSRALHELGHSILRG